MVFTGAATAIVTPLTKDGIDYEQFGRLIEWQISEGIQAIVAVGTTGEGSTLTDEEQAEALRAADKLMSLTFAVDTSRAGPAASPYPYVYDFYRVSDRRIMVVIREIGPNGQTLSQVSDFYISQFAFRKIVFNFVNLLNGKPVDPDTAY